MNKERGILNDEVQIDLFLRHSSVPCSLFFFLRVRVEGLEPPCLAASDPKSDTSTNFATPAVKVEGLRCRVKGSVYLVSFTFYHLPQMGCKSKGFKLFKPN